MFCVVPWQYMNHSIAKIHGNEVLCVIYGGNFVIILITSTDLDKPHKKHNGSSLFHVR